MQAITVVPMQAGSARLDEVAEPARADGDLLIQALAVGVCGTDLEITRGEYGWPPPGRDRLVLGHESSAGCWRRPPAVTCGPGTWSWPSSAGPIPNRV
jgi:glucose 1-dehydrogenase